MSELQTRTENTKVKYTQHDTMSKKRRNYETIAMLNINLAYAFKINIKVYEVNKLILTHKFTLKLSYITE